MHDARLTLGLTPVSGDEYAFTVQIPNDRARNTGWSVAVVDTEPAYRVLVQSAPIPLAIEPVQHGDNPVPPGN